jgi:Putative addiction module component
MSERVNQTAAAFRALSHEERMKVIRTVPESEQRLIVEGLSEAEDDDDVSEEVSRAWGKEIESRIDDIDSGRVKLIPYEETLARAREAIRRAR